MKMFSFTTYRILRALATGCTRLFHPVVKIKGRENIPEGAVVICCNHSSFSDPIYLLGNARLPEPVPIMAKQELMKIPVLGWVYRKLGAIPLDRSGNDLVAIKTAMKNLRDGMKLLIFPEGTRVRKGKKSEPHIGAVMLAVRTGTMILPCYVTAKKRFWRRIDVVYGKPYMPKTSTAKPGNEELLKLSEEMMAKIYALGEKA